MPFISVVKLGYRAALVKLVLCIEQSRLVLGESALVAKIIGRKDVNVLEHLRKCGGKVGLGCLLIVRIENVAYEAAGCESYAKRQY